MDSGQTVSIGESSVSENLLVFRRVKTDTDSDIDANPELRMVIKSLYRTATPPMRWALAFYSSQSFFSDFKY